MQRHPDIKNLLNRQSSTMPFQELLFKNYSLVEVIYLFIRFNKTKFVSGNTKNTDRNGINKQSTHIYIKHSEKDNIGRC